MTKRTSEAGAVFTLKTQASEREGARTFVHGKQRATTLVSFILNLLDDADTAAKAIAAFDAQAEEIAELRDRLSHRDLVPGTFCDSCVDWEQMAWERGKALKVALADRRAEGET